MIGFIPEKSMTHISKLFVEMYLDITLKEIREDMKYCNAEYFILHRAIFRFESFFTFFFKLILMLQL